MNDRDLIGLAEDVNLGNTYEALTEEIVYFECYHSDMTIERHVKLGRNTAFLSFAVGTIIFGLYFLTSSFDWLFIGYGFIVVIALVNLGVLFPILLEAARNSLARNKLIKVCGLMLLNIPAMLIYCWLSTILLNTMRISFTNATSKTLTEVNIMGCEMEHVGKLEAGQSKTVWIDITGDCSITIKYLLGNQQREETVAGYVTNNMGQKLRYNIGGLNVDPCNLKTTIGQRSCSKKVYVVTIFSSEPESPSYKCTAPYVWWIDVLPGLNKLCSTALIYF